MWVLCCQIRDCCRYTAILRQRVGVVPFGLKGFLIKNRSMPRFQAPFVPRGRRKIFRDKTCKGRKNTTIYPAQCAQAMRFHLNRSPGV
ncbi:hypothetical protein ALQ80_100419 [Pseudomonas coronafaciens pv. oryzae]|nr:hypothetical protein ALQ80_100419 [Pseudomonas coronafaciens pv. oryzae]RMN31168.1 hypothetical protein ALQ61_100394 [Pseudomonas coronafaciens pv. zizaniae]RMS08846.1 hypothetical protein ALP72_100727 [Pseudomonas coronafaciens pv. coronafaciens]